MIFTHVINPFLAAPGSEHHGAQAVTFAALARAVEVAKARGIDVEVLAVCYPEDLPAVEAPARPLGVLTRSVQDVTRLEPVKRFPIVSDILNAGAQHGSGRYLVFSNMDITPQPYFYDVLREMLEGSSGAPAVSVSRRTIDCDACGPEQLDQMVRQPGRVHWGHDTFAFPRDWVAKLSLGDICYGSAAFDKAIGANIDAISGYKARHYQYQHLTFHMGDDRVWAAREQYTQFNRSRVLSLYESLVKEYGKPPDDSVYMDLYRRTHQVSEPAPSKSVLSRIARRIVAVGKGPGPEYVMSDYVINARKSLGLNIDGFELK